MLGLSLQVFGAIETDEEIGFPQSSSQSVNVSKGVGFGGWGVTCTCNFILLKYKLYKV